MKKFFALVGAVLLLASPVSAAEAPAQAGFVCNTAKAAAEAAYFTFATHVQEVDDVAWLVSSPRDWCIAGVVKPSRPTTLTPGLEKTRLALSEERVFANTVVGAFSLAPFSFASIFNVFADALRYAPTLTVDLRAFVRENGRPGYYVTVRKVRPPRPDPLAFEKMLEGLSADEAHYIDVQEKQMWAAMRKPRHD